MSLPPGSHRVLTSADIETAGGDPTARAAAADAQALAGEAYLAAAILVNTVAALSAAPRVVGRAYSVGCLATPGDGGGGPFIWDATSTATADGYGVVSVPGVATGRFLAIFPDGVPVLRFGARAATTTITAAGMVLATVQAASGQAWLDANDTADLAAAYMAQAYVDRMGGGRVVYPNRGAPYYFSRTLFVHARVTHDLDGGEVIGTGVSNNTPRNFVACGRPFVFGIMAREDFPRLSTLGLYRTAGDLAVSATTTTALQVVAGDVWNPGDVVLIRTTSTSENPPAPTRPIPTVCTFNRVKAFDGAQITFEFPLEQAVAAPLLVNYSRITVIKQSIVGNGEPHVYYCADRASVINGTVTSEDDAAISWNSALACFVDIRAQAVNGFALTGNGWNRSYIRARPGSIWGGSKAALEIAVGSALSVFEIHAAFSGKIDPSIDPTSYYIAQVGENAFRCTVRGVIDAGGRVCNNGLNAIAVRGDYDLTLFNLNCQNAAVVLKGDRQRVRGEYHSLTTPYHCRASGVGDRLRASFYGTPGNNIALFVEASNALVDEGSYFEAGKLSFNGLLSGNYVQSLVPDGVAASGFSNNRPAKIISAFGDQTTQNDISTSSAGSTLTLDDFYWGRTVKNTGATGTITFALAKAAVQGMHMNFHARENFPIRIDPNGTNTIGTGGAGKYLEISGPKAYVELRCIEAGEWVIASSFGTLSYEP